MRHYWIQEEHDAVKNVKTMDEAAEIALKILARMSAGEKPIVQLCGPMTTGGLGDFEKNMARFNRAVKAAHERGLLVFDQVMFQEAMVRICNCKEGDPYPMDILEVFYRKVFYSGHIGKTLFLSGWESSLGARWERELALKLQIPIEEYPEEWLLDLKAS